MTYKEALIILKRIYCKEETTVEEMKAIGKAAEIMKCFQKLQEGGLTSEETINPGNQEGSQETS